MADQQKPLPFLFQFTAGAIAGTTELLAMYPLDVVKTRLQLATGKSKQSLVGVFTNIVKEEGPRVLYRGIVPPIMVEAPKRAVKFASNEQFTTLYKNLFGVDKMTQPLSILTGTSAGLTEALVIVPFELVKIRLQDKANAQRYKGTMDCLLQVVRTEGPLALFTGLESTFWRQGVWNGGYFGVIFGVKDILPKAETKSGQLGVNFIAGATGGVFGTILNTPFDVVKSRIQGHTGTGPRKYNWSLPSLALIYREEGFAALYKGFVPKVLRLGPGGGILLVVFEQVTTFMRKHLKY